MGDSCSGERAGRLLRGAGIAALVFTAAVLIPLGSSGLVAVVLLGTVVLPALSAAVCAVVTGGALARNAQRSRVPAAASAASLAASAAFFCVWWLGFEVGDSFPLNSRALLITEALVLAGVSTASLVALVLILRGRTRSVPRWATGAAWVTVGLVALVTGQLASLSVPRFELTSPAEEREQRQTCSEAQGLTSAPLDPGIPKPPVIPGAAPAGAMVLPAARTGDPVGTGLQRYADVGEKVVVSVATSRESDDEDPLAQIEQGLRASGLRNTGASIGSINGDEMLYAVSFEGPGRTGSIDIVPCGRGRALITAEAVPAGRTGVCAPAVLHARCDRLLQATGSVSRRFESTELRLAGTRLQQVIDTQDTSPLSFLTGDVVESFAEDGWRLVRSSCGDFCFGAPSPVTFVFARDGYTASAELTEQRPVNEVAVRITIIERR